MREIMLTALVWICVVLPAPMTLAATPAPDTILFTAWADVTPPLVLESKITLDHVRGRIDHLTADIARQRLYIAELGNNTVGVVDLKNHTVIRTLSGFHEPQGVGYESTTDMLYVANGGDGTVDLFQGAELTPAGKIALGDDADNVRVDAATHRVLVGFGVGALAVIDPLTRTKITDIELKGHPESFQIARSGPQIFVNVPDNREIAVIDSNKNQQVTSWKPAGLQANFPLAIDEAHRQVLAVFRNPSKLRVFNAKDGAQLGTVDTCEDADDVFVDAPRNRAYVSCGEGFIDVLTAQASGYVKVAHIATRAGARTALFVPEIDRLFLAVRSTPLEPAAIWVYRPVP